MVAQRGSPSSRHKGRSSRWSADRRKQKTRRMTTMFCPLPSCQILFIQAAGDHLIRCARWRRWCRCRPDATLWLHLTADDNAVVIIVVVAATAVIVIVIIVGKGRGILPESAFRAEICRNHAHEHEHENETTQWHVVPLSAFLDIRRSTFIIPIN